MNPEQALQILTNLSNLSVQNGGVFTSVEEAATVRMALQLLTNVVQENAELKSAPSTATMPAIEAAQ